MAKSTDRCEANGAGTFGSIQPVDLDDPLEGISLIGKYSRRDFIKGIIASGVAISGIPYMVNGQTGH